MTTPHRLYAISHSLYSGRARSYMIKQGIAFNELSTGHESFKAEALPLAQIPTIPTLMTPSGDVIRDGAAIIEHFEAANGRPCRPVGPKQQIISALFDVIGTDGLLRPAMHYRWNFPEQNLDFVHYHFLHSQRDMPEREAKTEKMMNRMRHVAMLFGVTEDTVPLVEELYLEFLQALNNHFEEYPYLLGWRPSIGDFGLIAPLYAHLGRDPYPMRLMQQKATRVARWVERMNRPDQDVPEYFNAGSDFVADDEIPDTLIAVLKVIAKDFMPETKAAAVSINNALASNVPAPNTPAVGRLAEAPGTAEFEVQGQSIIAMAQPYRFYLLQRVQATYDALSEAQQAEVLALLMRCDMAELLSVKLDRKLGRLDNLEVWL